MARFGNIDLVYLGKRYACVRASLHDYQLPGSVFLVCRWCRESIL